MSAIEENMAGTTAGVKPISGQHRRVETRRDGVMTTIIGVGVGTAIWAAWSLLGAPGPDWLKAIILTVVALVIPGYPVAVIADCATRANSAVVTIVVSLSVHLLVGEGVFLWAGGSDELAVSIVAGLAIVLSVVAARVRSVFDYEVLLPVSRRNQSRVKVGIVLALGIALHVWGSLQTNLADAGVFGAAALMKWQHYAALILVIAVISYLLTRIWIDNVSIGVAVLALVFIFISFVPLAGGTPSFPTVYVHDGIVNVLLQEREPVRGVDARFSWAGFFAALAYLVQAHGLPSIAPLMMWAPVVFSILLGLCVWSLARRLGGSDRAGWIAVLLYCLANWYQQDYLAPQSVALVIYLGIWVLLLSRPEAQQPLPKIITKLVAILGRFSSDSPGRTPDPNPVVVDPSAGKPVIIDAVVVLAAAAMVVSHQITPLILICGLGALSVTGRLRNPLLTLVVIVLFVTWFSYGAEDYWLGHFKSILDDIGEVGGSVSSGVTERLGAHPWYTRAQYVRIALSGGLFVVGGIAALRYIRRPLVVAYSLLMLAPFALIVMQSYGGEGIIRCFVIGSPFAASLAALLIQNVAKITPRKYLQSVVPVLSALAVFFLAIVLIFCRGLNTSFEHVPRDQVILTGTLISEMPEGSVVLTIGPSGLFFHVRALDVISVELVSLEECQRDIRSCIAKADPDFVYIPRQTMEFGQWGLGLNPAEFTGKFHGIADQLHYRVIVDEWHTTVFAREGMPSPVNGR